VHFNCLGVGFPSLHCSILKLKTLFSACFIFLVGSANNTPVYGQLDSDYKRQENAAYQKNQQCLRLYENSRPALYSGTRIYVNPNDNRIYTISRSRNGEDCNVRPYGRDFIAYLNKQAESFIKGSSILYKFEGNELVGYYKACSTCEIGRIPERVYDISSFEY
jgi:hypothetical protein